MWWGALAPSGAPVFYVATPDAEGKSTQLAEVDPANGSVRWQVRASGRLRPVGAAGGALYLLDNDAGSATVGVVRVEAATRLVHRVQLSPLYEAEATVAPDGTVYALEARGRLVAVGPERERWRLETGAAVASRPVFADGRVYLTVPDGRLLAMDAAAGRLVGQTRPRMGSAQRTVSATLPAPVVAGGGSTGPRPTGVCSASGRRTPPGGDPPGGVRDQPRRLTSRTAPLSALVAIAA